jgi:hypothetical protein
LPARAAIALLDEWLSWARRCRLRPFVKLARTIAAQREGIVAAIRHSLSNARVEAINTQIRLIARRAFGFHLPQALISLAMLKLGGLCPPLPGRVTVTRPTETSGGPFYGEPVARKTGRSQQLRPVSPVPTSPAGSAEAGA